MTKQIFNGDVKKPKVFEIYHFYYIDYLNGHLYIADRSVKPCEYIQVITIDQNTVKVIENYGDGDRITMGYKNKEYAMTLLANIKKLGKIDTDAAEQQDDYVAKRFYNKG